MEEPSTFDIAADAAYPAGEMRTARELVTEHYDILLNIARQRRRRDNVGETMRTTALVHEAFLKLRTGQQFVSDDHFLRSASLAMRHVVIDYVRRKLAARRDSDAVSDEEKAGLHEYGESPEQLLQIASMLEGLQRTNPRWVRIVDARYFAGMTEEETAAMLELSSRTVRRDWKAARAWIARQMTA